MVIAIHDWNSARGDVTRSTPVAARRDSIEDHRELSGRSCSAPEKLDSKSRRSFIHPI
jgi:hypothetical protein